MLEQILVMDRAVMTWVQETLHTPFGDRFFAFVTRLGDGGFLWLLIAVVLVCIRRTRTTGVAMLGVIVFGWLLGDFVIKPWVARLRPFASDGLYELLIEAPSGFSFPSGHSMASFAGATVLAFRGWRWAIPAYFMAVCIAFSRIYLYVHYPSDVLVGILGGILFGFAAGLLEKRFRQRRAGNCAQ